MGKFLRVTAAAVVGGVSSTLGGGKFKNGAVTAAFGRLFNHELPGHTDEKHFRTAAGVELTEDIESKVGIIADSYFAATGDTLLVTSGTRSPASQAEEMYDNLQAGDRLGLYKNVTAAAEIRDAYDAAMAGGMSRTDAVVSMTAVIERQVSNGIYISKHLMSGAVDFRSRGMNSGQVAAFRAAAAPVAKSVLLETARPHWHVQF